MTGTLQTALAGRLGRVSVGAITRREGLAAVLRELGSSGAEGGVLPVERAAIPLAYGMRRFAADGDDNV